MHQTAEYKLSIVIPAYNEEQAIASIIERSLASREDIIRNSPVSSVEIIVVNDGSRDSTADIAAQYKHIKLISYEKNRGYGAAIKTGFENASGNLLAFLDADGTCDPKFFAELCSLVVEEEADIAIGSRMNPMSEMPRLRRLGNWFYAKLINYFGDAKITDSASGMRVIRRDSLGRIYPLPDGLHFTPAMSVRAVLDRNLKIVEVPMPYKERTGKSKLSVVKDGVRFLRVIVSIALTHRPFKLFATIGLIFLIAAFLLGIQPLIYYLANGEVVETMIYRFITILTLTLAGINLIALGVLSNHIVALINGYEPDSETAFGRFLERSLFPKLFYVSILFMLLGVVLNIKTIHQYVSFRHIYVHWIYVLTGALLVLSGIELLAFSVLRKIVLMLKEKLDFERDFSGSKV